ncbi:MAG: DUF2628 domain-containing protein [Rhodobiaceae bacterium]|nr:DUF2628 domain-containing protein [Rhodobiaceae bacterium]
MVVYTAHAPTGTRPRSLRDGDAVVFVKDGFSLAAMLVPLFWLLAHRCWWHSLAVLAGAVALGLLVRFHPQYDGAATIVGLLASLLVGLEANGWRRWSLSQRGHDMLGVCSGRDRQECERRFFESWLARDAARTVSVSPAAPAVPARPAISRAPTTPASPAAPGIVGLFPDRAR